MRPDRPEPSRVSFDVVLLFFLLLARVRIDTLAEWAAIPSDMLHGDVARLMGRLLSAPSLALLSDRQTTDAVTLVLISLAFGCFLLYAAVDMCKTRLAERVVHDAKMALAALIIGLLVVGQTCLFIGLRHVNGPASYTHDGGVIQTEITVDYFLRGINPYVADYLDTPMAAWGTEYRTALYHYPYLPWTFLFSTPFYLLSTLSIGWFDQRFVYLGLFILTLVLATSMTRERRDRVCLLMLLGLNPILASDVIFGQNDAFVLGWLVLGFWLLYRAGKTGDAGGPETGRRYSRLAMVVFGLAFASKPTAWFVAPFLAIYLVHDILPAGGRRRWDAKVLRTLIGRIWPLLVVFLLVVGPWLVWDAPALVDDVWGWSSGVAANPYQIRGWGASNFVLAFGWVPDRLAYWPFWIPELIVGAGLLVLLGWRQVRHNTLPSVILHYAVFVLAFLYVSRFLNENYLGYVASLLALGLFVDEPIA